MLLSHLGRPVEGQYDEASSLKPVAEHLSILLGKPVRLEKDWLDGIVIAPVKLFFVKTCASMSAKRKTVMS